MQDNSLKISKRTFITSVLILLVLMLFAGILTQTLPQGSFQRTVEDGREVVVAGSYEMTENAGRMPFWRVFTAPVEVLWSQDGMTVIGIILFLMLISGSISLLNRSGIMNFAMGAIVDKSRNKKYRLLLLITLIFMLFGAFVGVYEESVALVPFAVALAVSLGWDELTGVGMSVLAAGFGFSSAVTNPFTLAIAQRLSGLPVYSGLWFHLLSFVIMYGILSVFLCRYAVKLDKKKAVSGEEIKDEKPFADGGGYQGRKMSFGVRIFAVSMFLMVGIVAAGIFVPVISQNALIFMMLPLTIGSIAAVKCSGYRGKMLKEFLEGILGMLPSVLMILMAASIKLIVEHGGILDTILYYASMAAQKMGGVWCALLVFGIILILNFFIASGSAKAFLVMPIIVPLADLVGITRQTVVTAFCFGDGFSNVVYPTNPVLLICLGISGIAYSKWFKWTWKLQGSVLIVCLALISLAYAVELGPF